MSEITSQEKKVTSASYFFSFYSELQQLNHNEAQYQNFILEINNKYGVEGIDKADEAEKNIVMQQIQLLRYNARKCWIMFNALSPSLKWEKGNIEEAYKRIQNTYVFDRQDIETYIIFLNEKIVSATIQELLEKSQDLIESIYANPTTEQPK